MRISVFITSYNQRTVLVEAIDSVLAQTLKPYEIIIVDDCSSDGSQELINSYKDKFPKIVKPIFHERNLGVSQARVHALESVKGDYVTYVDGDDLFLPEKLDKEAELIKKGNFHIAFSNNYYFKGKKDLLRIWAYNKSEVPDPGNMYADVIARKFPRNSLYRMELVNYNLWKRVGFHDTNLRIYEDYDMRIRLSKEARINFTLEPYSMVRTDTHNLSKSSAAVHRESLDYIYKKHYENIIKLSNEGEGYAKEGIESFISKYDSNQHRSKRRVLNQRIKKKLVTVIKKYGS